MTAAMRRAALAVAGMLTVLLVLAWLPTPEPPALPRPRPVQVGAAATAPDDAPDYDEIADTVLARPLFSIGRKPHKEAVVSGRIGGDTMPRLSGIMITPYGRRAIFTPDTGKPQVLAVGATVAEHAIRAIDPDGVQLDGVPRKLRPTLDRQHAAQLTPNIITPGMVPQPFQPGVMPQPFQPQPFQPPQPPGAGEDGEPPAVAPIPPPFRGPVVPRGRE